MQMDYVNFGEWLDRRYAEANRENKEHILHAKILLKNAIGKLEDAGFIVNPVIPISSIMGMVTPSYLQLTYQEACRVLLIRDYIVNKNITPTANYLAAFRKKNPLPYDGQNETKIITELEKKNIISLELDQGKGISDLEISLTPLGEEAARDIANDNEFLKRIFKRSRNTKLKEFTIGFIDKGRKDLFRD